MDLIYISPNLGKVFQYSLRKREKQLTKDIILYIHFHGVKYWLGTIKSTPLIICDLYLHLNFVFCKTSTDYPPSSPSAVRWGLSRLNVWYYIWWLFDATHIWSKAFGGIIVSALFHHPCLMTSSDPDFNEIGQAYIRTNTNVAGIFNNFLSIRCAISV